MPTELRGSDTPTRMQLLTLERMMIAHSIDIFVHPATVPYQRRVGMMRRGWIATTYNPVRHISIHGDGGPALIVTERGRAVIVKFSKDEKVRRLLCCTTGCNDCDDGDPGETNPLFRTHP